MLIIASVINKYYKSATFSEFSNENKNVLGKHYAAWDVMFYYTNKMQKIN